MTTTERTSLATHVTGALPASSCARCSCWVCRGPSGPTGTNWPRRCARYGLNVDMAGVYRELRSMEQHDLLASDWEPSDNGPDRRVYELTDRRSGRRRAAVAELDWPETCLTAALDDAKRLTGHG